MTNSVDNEVVSITFDNRDFEARAQQTLQTLEKLSKGMNFSAAGAGFDGITKAADKVSFGGISSGVDTVNAKISSMAVVAAEVVRRITDAAINVGKKVSSSVFDPLVQGGKQRALNIEQAKFQFRGLGVDITKAMASANEAVLGTAYGLDSAAKEAAQLSASGIKVGADMTQALRATAGAAAMTGSSFDEIAQIFTTVAGVGKVGNQQLNEFAFRGLNAAAAIAQQLGITEAQVHQMAASGKLDFATFSKAMDQAFGAHAQAANQTFLGSLANMHAALSRIGAAFQAPLLDSERDVFNALSPAIKKVQLALGPLIDSFTIFTNLVSTNLVKFIGKINFGPLVYGVKIVADGMNHLIEVGREIGKVLGGAFRDIFPAKNGSQIITLAEAFKKLVDRIRPSHKALLLLKNIFRGVFLSVKIVVTVLANVIKIIVKFGVTILKAFRTVFPASNQLGRQFVALEAAILRFVRRIQPTKKGLNELKSIFVAVFSVARIVGRVIKDVVEILGRLVGGVTKSSGGLLAFIAHLADVVSWCLHFTLAGSGMERFLSGLGDTILHPIRALGNLKNAILEVFSGKHMDTGRVGQRFNELTSFPGKVVRALRAIDRFFHPIITGFKEVGKFVASFFHDFAHNIGEAFKKGNFQSVLDAINVGLLGGIALLIHSFFHGGVSLDFSRGFFGRIGKSLNNVNSSLQLMQSKLKAQALLKIAGAIAIMAASMVVLSLIDSKNLTKALAAMVVGFGELVGVFAVINKIGGTGKDAAKLNAIASAMVIFSVAVTVLSLAISKLGKLKMGDLSKGMLAVTLLLGDMVGVTHLIDGEVSGMIRASIALVGISTALIILGEAVKVFAKMKMGDMLKGLLGVSIGITVLSGALNLLPDGMALKGAGLIEAAIGLNILALAVKQFGNMSWKEMGKGLLGIAAAMDIIGAAVNLLPTDLPLTAAGLILVGVALSIIAEAVKIMGGIKMGTLAKGIGAIAVVLILLSGALNAMEETLPAAAAMIVAAGALAVMAEVIKTLGKLPIAQLIEGLLAIAAVFAVVGGATLLLTPIIPEMLLLGAALVVIGAGFALFGIGLQAVGKGIQYMAEAGEKGTKSLMATLSAIAQALPELISAFVVGIVKGLGHIVDALPALVKVIWAFGDALLNALTKLLPKVFKLLGVLIDGIVFLLGAKQDEIIQAGFSLLMAFLKGLDKNMGKITDKAIDILVNFINAIASNIQPVVDAGANLLIQFLLGLAKDTQKILDAATQLINTIILGIAGMATQIEAAGATAVTTFLNGLSSDVKKIGKAATDLINTIIFTIAGMGIDIGKAGAKALADFLNGIANDIGTVCDAAHRVIHKFVGCLGELAGDILGAGVRAIGSFTGGIFSNIGSVVSAGAKAIGGFVLGIFGGFGHVASAGFEAIVRFASTITSSITALLGGIGSQGYRIAKAIIDGINHGIDSLASTAWNKITSLASSLFKGAMKAIGANSPSKKFMLVGNYIVQGLAVGIDNHQAALDSATGMANNVIDAFSKTLSTVPNLLGNMEDLNPVIAPVLDLSSVRNEAKKLNGIIGVPTISPDVSYGNAAAISVAAIDGQNGSSDTPPMPTVTTLNFEQTINAPEPLTANVIYRNTKSQFAQAKEELQIA